jgi:hypothetical protein
MPKSLPTDAKAKTAKAGVTVSMLVLALVSVGCGRTTMAGKGVVPGGSSADAGNSGGACLLEYNGALVAGDPCCYREAGANTCNTSIACNDRSGARCCLIYAAEGAGLGNTCCLYDSSVQYANDESADASECQQLLSESRNRP